MASWAVVDANGAVCKLVTAPVQPTPTLPTGFAVRAAVQGDAVLPGTDDPSITYILQRLVAFEALANPTAAQMAKALKGLVRLALEDRSDPSDA